MEGLVASLAGGLVVGLAYYLGIAMAATQADLAVAPVQVPPSFSSYF